MPWGNFGCLEGLGTNTKKSITDTEFAQSLRLTLKKSLWTGICQKAYITLKEKAMAESLHYVTLNNCFGAVKRQKRVWKMALKRQKGQKVYNFVLWLTIFYFLNNQSYLHSAFCVENWTKKMFVRSCFCWNLKWLGFSDCQIPKLFSADWEIIFWQ